MTSMTIRDIDPETKQALRLKAAKNNRSMEAEVRVMLRQHCKPDDEEHVVVQTRRMVQDVDGIDLSPLSALRSDDDGEGRIPDFTGE